MVTQILHFLPAQSIRSLKTLYKARRRLSARQIARPIFLTSLVLAILAGTVNGSMPVPLLTTTCTTLASSANTSFTNGGTVLFTCGTNPALAVNRPGSATPVFQLPKGYVLLTIIPHHPGSQKCGQGLVLESGEDTEFPTAGNFDYCAVYNSPPGTILASFTLTWFLNRAEQE